MRPYRQGDLNGLCGIYAVVNALHLLLDAQAVPEFGEDIFQTAARALPKDEYPQVLWEGMTHEALVDLARRACRRVKGRIDVKIAVERPYGPDDFPSARAFAAELAQVTRSGYASAILWLDWGSARGGGAHWTVFKGATRDQLRLFDGSERHLSLAKLRLRGDRGDRLVPEKTILLRIVEIEGEPVEG